MNKKVQVKAINAKSQLQFFLRWSLPLIMAGLYFFLSISGALATWSETDQSKKPENQGWESSFPEADQKSDTN